MSLTWNLVSRAYVPLPYLPRLAALLLFVFLVVGCRASEQPPPASAPQAAALGGEIQGALYADLGTGTENAIALPGLEVLLKPAGSEQVVDNVVSDLHGRFALPRQKQGSYRICWKGEGWVSQCLPEPVVLGEDGHYADLIAVKPDLRPGSGVLSGRITLADGTSPVFEYPLFAIKEIPQIRLGGVDRPIPVNAAGQFVVPGVSTTRPSFRIQLGREKLEPSFKAEALDFRGITPLVLTSPNHRPVISSVTAVLDGKQIGTVRPEETVEVKAEIKDEDGDAPRFRWAVGGGSGTLTQPEQQTARWTLPKTPGTYTAYVLVRDERGGFAQGSIHVQVTQDESKLLAAAGAATCKPVQLCTGCPQWSGYPGSSFLTFAGTGSDTGAQDYYAAVDPQGKRKTLGTWWTVNGFGSGGSGGVRASYLNHNDLGFGRDMHCIQNGQDVACYVTNYGCPDQNPSNADLAAAANPADRVATVTMEYSAVEGQDPTRRIVKFFVYKGGTEDSPRITGADLDGFGDKYVPQLCLSCHGGQYSPGGKPSIDDIDMKSSFREFDLPSFRYTGGRDFTKLTSKELDTFKALNDMVVASNPSDPIKQLVAGFYAAGGSKFNDQFVPAQWIDAANPLKEQLYLGVVAHSCRTCHVAFRGGTIDWSTYSQFQRRRSTTKFYVCGSSKIMPHAAITYINFWSSHSPSLPDQLAQFEASDWTKFGTCK